MTHFPRARSASLIGLGAVLLCGCVTMSRSTTLTSDEGALSGGRVESVTLERPADMKVTPGFDDLFKSHVKARLDRCAQGSRPLRLDARISRLDKANPVMTTLIGGANVVRGEARLVDVATGKVLGDYQIGQTVVGGRIAIIKMGQAEEQISDGFGDEVCKQAFPAAR